MKDSYVHKQGYKSFLKSRKYVTEYINHDSFYTQVQNQVTKYFIKNIHMYDRATNKNMGMIAKNKSRTFTLCMKGREKDRRCFWAVKSVLLRQKFDKSIILLKKKKEHLVYGWHTLSQQIPLNKKDVRLCRTPPVAAVQPTMGKSMTHKPLGMRV